MQGDVCEPAGDAARLDFGRPLLLPGAAVGPWWRGRTLDRWSGGYRLGHVVVSRSCGAKSLWFCSHSFLILVLVRRVGVYLAEDGQE